MLYQKTDKIRILCNPESAKDIFEKPDWEVIIKDLAEKYGIEDVSRFTNTLINLKRLCNVRKYVDKKDKLKKADSKSIEKIINYFKKARVELRKLLFNMDGSVEKLIFSCDKADVFLNSLLPELESKSNAGRPDTNLKQVDMINMLVLVYRDITQLIPKCTHSNVEKDLYDGEIFHFIKDIGSLLGLRTGSANRIYKNIKNVIDNPPVEKNIIYKRMLGL